MKLPGLHRPLSGSPLARRLIFIIVVSTAIALLFTAFEHYGGSGDRQALELFVWNVMQIFLVAGIAFAFFHYVVNRHLHDIAGYMRGFDLYKGGPLTLARRANDRPDELDEVVMAINFMHANARSMFGTLRECDARYWQIVDNFPKGSVTIYNRDLRIVSVNGKEFTESGLPSTALVGKHFAEIAPPETWAIAEPHLREALAGKVSNYETPYYNQTFYSVFVTPFREVDGAVTEIMVMAVNITDRKVAEQNVRSYADKLMILSRKLLQVQEDERSRLARDLHDQVGQALTALKINLQVIVRQPAAGPVKSRIEECVQIADEAIQQVRTLVFDLRPPQLDELELAVALRTHAERLLSPANLALHFSAPAVPPPVRKAIDIVCFRIMQETLTNVLRHAGARNVWIGLAVDGDTLELTVRDDGRGFDLADAHRHAMQGDSVGLLSMEERAALVDGRIEITTMPGAGTTVRAIFPLQAQAIALDPA